MSPQYPTLADVAARAGVSVATAGRALQENPKNRVSAEVVALVRAAAEEFGYVPNAVARSLRGAPPTSLGLVIGDMLDPYFGEIATAVTVETSKLSKFALVANMQRDPQLELEWCEQLWKQRVRGVVLSGGGFDQITRLEDLRQIVGRMQGSGVWVISLSPRGMDIPVISVDNGQVGRLAARRVLKAGHRRVGLIFGPSSLATEQRMRAVQEHLDEDGAVHHLCRGGYNAEAGARGVDLLLRTAEPPTAVIAGSDSIAVGAMQRLHQLGYRVPEDISVTGIGGTILGRLANPRIASIDLSLAEAGRAAVRHVFEEPGEPLPELIPKLVEGGSLGPARQ